MNDAQASVLRALLEEQRVASLGTLHKGEPAVSMAPFAVLPDGAGFVIHVSSLATHTRDMLADPAVSLMVMASPSPAVEVRALPRATFAGRARQCPAEAADYPLARQRYLARFPDSEPMFSFGDFSLFIIAVRSVRFVGGFGQATSILAERFADVMREKP